jgi:glycosyltransferase involved in cell wall biosynthesis
MNPTVSIITPTYNRRSFIPHMIDIYSAYDYPKDRMEWIIIDDSIEPVKDLFDNASKTIPNIRYYYFPDKMLIGEKRNKLNEFATGDIIVAMDDDDYYPPERIRHIVQKFGANPGVQLAGSSVMYLYFVADKTVCKVGPYGPNHSTNGTLAYRKSYAKSHVYDIVQTHAEEQSFLENYRNPMIQLDPMKCILCICHSDNTFDKMKIRMKSAESKTPVSTFQETSMKLRDFVKNEKMRKFYGGLK